ncbi:MAG: 50S ribosomal protein L21 [Deltaproteobacteria bacterium]|jgi:large subunit ribosomal protein L21|nr:50S ribosomal protein L21 [Deltaproteobacteria bacterium]
MYAIVQEGGRQYKVEVGQKIRVNRLPGFVPAESAGPDDNAFVFKNVVLIRDDTGIKTGSEFLSGVSVTGRIVEETRGKKILVFKKKRRTGYHKARGHRQDLSVVEITGISTGGGNDREAKDPDEGVSLEKSAEEGVSLEKNEEEGVSPAKETEEGGSPAE